MTEYWVSQGNKWCEFCKIYIQNNPTSIRNHELGTRHRDNVNKKLSDMREKSAAKDKELKEAERMLQQIEAKATRSYQKDIETLQKTAKANGAPDDGQGGKWVTQEEAYAAVKTREPLIQKPIIASRVGPSTGIAPAGRVVPVTLNPMRPVKGAPSSIDVGKRKRQNEKPKKICVEERGALKAREAARKRVEEREKPLFGLYNRPI